MIYQVKDNVLIQYSGLVFDAKIRAAYTDARGTRFRVHIPSIARTVIVPVKDVLRQLTNEEMIPEVLRKRRNAQADYHYRIAILAAQKK